MGTFLFDKIVFGPIKSRRLGHSLGINLLSTSHKVCNFDCIYCECGFSDNKATANEKFCNTDSLFIELEKEISKRREHEIDAITYAGNGEPTLHPRFLSIAKKIKELRDQYSPKSKIVLLTNGTTLHKSSVQQAFKFIDDVLIKLDAGSNELIEQINKPLSQFGIDKLIANLKQLETSIKIQSMFLEGTVNGKDVSNTRQENLNLWLKWITQIEPKEVYIYSINRDTPVSTLYPVSNKKLEQIALKVRELGIKTIVT